MKQLLKCLDETGWSDPNEWPGFPAQRIIKSGGWLYQWLILNPRFAQLVRSRRPDGKWEFELFVAKEESRCLYWARKLREGIEPESPEVDPRTGIRAAFL